MTKRTSVFWIQRHKWLLICSATVGMLLAWHWWGRKAPQLENATGDPALVQFVERAEIRARRLSVLLVDHGEARVAHWNADETTRYELGSVSKALTGLVLADAQTRDELRVDAQIKTYGIPEIDGPLQERTLAQLATHRSGLPRVALTPKFMVGAYESLLFGSNPYRGDVEDVMKDANEAPLGEARFSYSNLGAALLGQIVARQSGLDYAQLMKERLFEPLGMQDSAAQTNQALVETGTSNKGGEHDPWVMGAYAPCGAIVSSTRDMRILVSALLEGRAPGMEATKPRYDIPDQPGQKIGYFWFTTPCPTNLAPDREVIWHNGATGGYGSFVGFDTESQRAVALMAASAVDLDRVGIELLCGDPLDSIPSGS